MISKRIPALRGIHHVKLAVSDLDRSLHFYEKLFGAVRIPEADHHRESTGDLYAYILRIPGLQALLELRLDPDQARRHRRFNPITIAVADRAALTAWETHLESQKIPHSSVITAIESWLIVVEDPDQTMIRLYSLEKHGRELRPDENNMWLS